MPEDIKIVVNLDIHDGLIGTNSVVILVLNKQIKNYLEVYSKEYGLNLNIGEDIYSSDSMLFASKNMLIVNFHRSSEANFGVHNIDGNTKYFGREVYRYFGPFIYSFIKMMANSEEFPFLREMPENMKKKVIRIL